jgi:hypothetical protein
MTAEQWLGVWIVIGGIVLFATTAVTVAVGLAWILNAREAGRGGCRVRGCRLEAGRHGCTRAPVAEGSAAGDTADLARVGWAECRLEKRR